MSYHTGGQKFGILTLISLSLKINKWLNLKTCLVKFSVLGYQNTKKRLNITSMSDPQINLNRLGCVKKKWEPNTSNFTRHMFLYLLFYLFFNDNKINVNIPNFCPLVYMKSQNEFYHVWIYPSQEEFVCFFSILWVMCPWPTSNANQKVNKWDSKITSKICIHTNTTFTRSKNYQDHYLDCNLDIHCSIQRSPTVSGWLSR